MKMRHEKDEVMKALAFLDTFSNEEEYKNNLTIIYDYFSDLVDLVNSYQDAVKKATELNLKMVGAYANNREGRRKLQKTASKL